jgi:hypothetical protein
VRVGHVEVAVGEGDRAKPGQRKGSVIGEARPLRPFERSALRGGCRLGVSALLCQARFEQGCRDRAHVVVGVEMDGFGRQRSGAFDVPSAERAEGAGHGRRRDAPRVPQLFEGAARVIGELDRAGRCDRR